ncbi:STAS domain-containing protein [Gemmatimonadota bacterium]
MHIHRRVIDANTALVAVHGRMMGGPGHGRLHDTVKRLSDRGAGWIVIDLGNVEWMNSSGLGDLMGCLTTVRRSGGDIVVARATRKVRSLFMIMKVMEIFDTRDTVRAALVRLRELRADRQRASEQGAWPEVTSGPEDWAFVQDRLKADRDADVAHDGLAERADTRSSGRFRHGKRFGRPRPMLSLWGRRMIE